MSQVVTEVCSFTIGAMPWVPFPKHCVVCEVPTDDSTEVAHQSLTGISAKLNVPVCRACKQQERWSAAWQTILLALGAYVLTLLIWLALCSSWLDLHEVEASDILPIVAGSLCPALVFFVVAVSLRQTSLWPFPSPLGRAFRMRGTILTFRDKGYALATLLGYQSEVHSQIESALQGGADPYWLLRNREETLRAMEWLNDLVIEWTRDQKAKDKAARLLGVPVG
jgi:hypothetical protein